MSELPRATRIRVTVHEWGKHPMGCPFVLELGQNTLLSGEETAAQLFNSTGKAAFASAVAAPRLKCLLQSKTWTHTQGGPRPVRGINLTWMRCFSPWSDEEPHCAAVSIISTHHCSRWTGGAAAFLMLDMCLCSVSLQRRGIEPTKIINFIFYQNCSAPTLYILNLFYIHFF